jgi:hypothetical protein
MSADTTLWEKFILSVSQHTGSYSSAWTIWHPASIRPRSMPPIPEKYDLPVGFIILEKTPPAPEVAAGRYGNAKTLISQRHSDKLIAFYERLNLHLRMQLMAQVLL